MILICLGSFLFTTFSKFMSDQSPDRIASNIVTGIGFMIDADSHQPVDLYVDTKTNDTIYGRTGKVINGYVVKDDKGVYAYRDWDVKQDGDEYKAKTDDAKIKSEDGESKVKNGSYTKKS